MKTRISILLAALALLAAVSAAHAATITWTNTSGGSWFVTNNWSPHQLPINTDNALITVPGTYTVAIDNSVTVNVIITNLTLGAGGGASGVQTLVLMNSSSGGFTANSMTVTNGGVFNVSADNRSLSGTMTVTSGGVFNLIAVHAQFYFGMDLTVTNGGVANAIGYPFFGAGGTPGSTFYAPVTVANGGWLTASQVQTDVPVTVAHGGAMTISNFDFYSVSGFSSLSNAGTINLSLGGIYAGLMNQADGVINLQGATYCIGSYFTNQGTLTASAGAGATVTINVAVFDPATGSVSNLTGTLALVIPQGILKGAYNTAAGAVIQFAGTNNEALLTQDASLVLSGSGQFQLTSGNLLLPTDWNPKLDLIGTTLRLGTGFQGGAITNLALDGIALSNGFPVTGPFTVRNSTVAGNFTLASGGVLTASNATFTGVVPVSSGGQLNVGGPLTLNAALTNAGTINLTNFSITINSTGAVNQTGGAINFWGDGDINFISGGSTYFINRGTLAKNAGPGTTSSIMVTNFDNSQGTVTNLAGTLALGIFQSTLAGIYYAAAGATTQVTANNGATPIVPGTPLIFAGGGENQFLGGFLSLPTNVIPGLKLLGGSLQLGAGFQGGAITNLMIGNMTMTNTLPVTGRFTATNSTLYGNFTVASGGDFEVQFVTLRAATTVANGGVLSLFEGASGFGPHSGGLTLFAPLNNAGTINLTNAQMFIANDGTAAAQGGVINQASGRIDFWGAGVIANYFFGNQDYLVNQGAIAKRAGSTFSGVIVHFGTNAGVITAQTGTMGLSGVTLQSTGSLNVGLNSATDYGSFVVPTNIVLAGAFNATLNNGYVPANGTTFNVLSYGSFAGSFSSLGLPAAVSWQSNYGSTNFALVAGSGSPQFGTVNLSGTNLIFNGMGGTAGSNYVVLASTNLTLPLTNWLALTTNTFDGSGQFHYTNNVNPAKPWQFFIFKLP